jgi:hypothetical protein
MGEPIRIQRKRTKGWRMPAGAVYVGRRDLAATCFRQMVNEWSDPPASYHATGDYPDNATIRAELSGRDLACWCPLDQPCHADVLLEVANR